MSSPPTASGAGVGSGAESTGAPVGPGMTPEELAACGNPCRAERFAGADFSPKPPVQALTPGEQLERMILRPGYRMEPVLTDPEIRQPGAIAFDGNGRMYVLELRSYMLDADATDELAPISRISRWEDTNGDGVYDRGTVFVDSLVFPRFVTPLTDGVILTKESNSEEVWKYTDTNGDGRADRRELFATNFGRSANIEHQESHLTWALDNWMYATYENVRLRWTPSGSIRETIGNPGGAWGVTQDDDGKIFIQAGASGLPGYFQLPLHYGNFPLRDEIPEEMRTVWGAPIGIADMQGGMPEVRMPDGSLLRTTAGSGADVFRGHRLPEELRGDYFYGEVVGRIVRRIRPTKEEGLTRLANVYEEEKGEFIASMDPLFRPVDMTTAPDGTMYIVDMYHGIIQQAFFAPPGSYLRARIEQYQLDRINSRGRIWRLTYEGMERDRTQPRMYEETSAELVRHLEHPNGWWRDMAQRQLVLRQDRSVVPALQTMARTHGNELARIHALWTLEGLGALEPELVREWMRDANPRLRIHALRTSETLYKAGDQSFAADYRTLVADSDPEVAMYALLTMNVLRVPNTEETARTASSAGRGAGVEHVASVILNPPPRLGGGVARPPEEMAILEAGQAIYHQACGECHGEAGTGTPAGAGRLIAPGFAGSARVAAHPEYVIKSLLHGLTGPIDGVDYVGGLMVPMGAPQSDEWVAAVTSYIRTSFGNTGSMVGPQQVAEVRAANSGRTTLWTYAELMATVPSVLQPQPSWRVSASHSAPTRVGGSSDPARAFTLEGWTTGVAQEPGMWFQVDLGEAVSLTELEFASPNPPGGPPGSTPVAQLLTAPRQYEVQVSNDGTSWSTVARGQGTARLTSIRFTPVRARYLRINQTGSAGDRAPWSMAQVRLYQRQPPQ